MQIVEINEPRAGDNAEDSIQIAVGIDFGTTNSLIAIAEGGNLQILCDEKGRSLIPSVISYTNGKFIIGDKAINLEDTIFSIKRLMGKNYEEILKLPTSSNFKHLIASHNNIPKLQFDDKYLTIPEVAAEIFKYLKNQAQEVLKTDVSSAVVTIPAYFDDTAKGQVVLAARLAGFQVLRLIAEPTAAAYAYGLQNNIIGNYLVYDFGGGTFDVSILNMQKGILQVIATGGDNLLGGDDIDTIIAGSLSLDYKLENSNELRQIAQTIKEHLTAHDDCSLELNGKQIFFTKIVLEKLIYPIIMRSINIVKEVLEEANHIKLDGIVLIGGTSKIPLVTELLQKNFNTQIFSDISPEKAVAYGAALQAQNLTTKINNSLIVDVLPLSLGIELYGGIMEKIILRNSPIPFSITKEFTTYVDNQTAMQFHILQGEREMAPDCRSLARFELKNIPHMKAGQIKVEVTFSVDVNGILSVSVFENVTTKSHIIEVNPTFGLNHEEITQILNNAYQNAASDHQQRLLKESKLKLESLIYDLENILKESLDMLNTEDINNAQQAIQNSKQVITSDDREIILNATEILEESLELIGSSILNCRVGKLLHGRHIDFAN